MYLYSGDGARGKTAGMDGRRGLLGVTEKCIRVREQAATSDVSWHMCHLSTFPKVPSLAGRVSIQGARETGLGLDSTAPEPSALRTVTVPGN